MYIHNITLKPSFGGNTSRYTFSILYSSEWLTVAKDENQEKTIQVNCIIDSIYLRLGHVNGYFYFNDVIINYTPLLSINGKDINYNINGNNNLSKIQNQLYFLELNINSITNDISNLQKDMNDLKDKINNIKNNKQSSYDNATLQEQINNLTQQINSIKGNLSKINNSIPLDYNDSALKSSMFILEYDNIIIKQKINVVCLTKLNLTK